ncbi:MAG: hypothetical protein FWH14_04585 [Oscillospiraceae bacterium]|nr:hypothetical protein [Oscillospiraceae bacterium]
MYKNISATIKTAAPISAWIGFIGSVAIGVILKSEGVSAVFAISVLISGSLTSLGYSLFAYGFGELIEKTTEIAENTSFANSSQKTTEILKEIERVEEEISGFLEQFENESDIRDGDAVRLHGMRVYLAELYEQAT